MLKITATLLLICLPIRLFAHDVAAMTTSDLLPTYVAIQDELAARDVASSGNLLTGQLGEYLFINAFGWEAGATSQAGFDAVDGSLRIQIKARRLSQGGGNEQLGAIRDLDGFDVLAVVLFSHGYQVVAASLISAKVVRGISDFDAHTNSWHLMCTDALSIRYAQLVFSIQKRSAFTRALTTASSEPGPWGDLEGLRSGRQRLGT